MKHFLLPKIERDTLLREYRIRMVIVLLFMISLAFIIGIVAKFPAFIFANIEENVQAKNIENLKKGKEKSGVITIEKELASDKLLLNAVLEKEQVPDISDIISGLMSMRGSVKVLSVAVSYQATTTIGVVIQGIAPTRESLLNFKNTLEKTIASSTVDLPISSLAKSTNIQFSLQLIQNFQ